MPPLPQITAPALRALAEELRYAPRAALLKDVARAEALAADLNEQQAYPADWLVFRITGYRPDMPAPPLVAGADALADLSSLVERLSDAARMTPEELDAGALRVEELQERWGVSAKTISRWRRRGLIARRVRDTRARSRLAFQPEAIRQFEVRRADELAAASGFHRFTDEERRRSLEAALEAAGASASLNLAARQIAGELGRSHEAVRQLLMREDARRVAAGAAPIFGHVGPPSARERNVWERAWRRGIDDRELARRAGRPVASVRRAILERRAERLRLLALAPRADTRRGGDGARGGDADGEDPLALPIVRRDLMCPGACDLAELVAQIGETTAPVGFVEMARARAYHHLLRRAKLAIEALPSQGVSARALDAIETDLRWAGRLKLELMRAQMRLVGAAAEETAGTSLESLPARDLGRLLLGLIDALAAAVDTHDPFRGGRLAATAGLQLGRAAARLAPRGDGGRGGSAGRGTGQASRRLATGIAVDDWTRRAVAWWWLEPDRRVARGLSVLDDRDRALLTLRFGYEGEAPVTLDEAAQQAGLTRIQAPRRERAAIRRAVAAGREARR